jgi:hypothetical protein
MLKKLLVLALTSGLVAKLYKTYAGKHGAGSPAATNPDSASPKRPARRQV